MRIICRIFAGWLHIRMTYNADHDIHKAQNTRKTIKSNGTGHQYINTRLFTK
jgi:hypothetical protein